LGLQGVDGAQGIQGIQGRTGAQGIPGEVSAQGIQGVQGRTGAQGISGDLGSVGPQGVQGFRGIQGSIGPQGISGDLGSIGPQGVQGFTGSQGRTGSQGTSGDLGLQGLPGSQGIQGRTGAQGTNGSQGIQGPLTPSYSELGFACSDESTNLTTGTKVAFSMPYDLTASSVRLSANTAPTGGPIVVDVTKGGTSIFSVKPSIVAGAKSGGANAVFTTTSLDASSEINIVVNNIGTSAPGTGLKIWVMGTRV
jgi:hypothetical protein